MLKQSIMEMEKALNNAKRNRDPNDGLKVKMTEKNGRDILGYLKTLEELQNKFRNIR